MGRHASARSFAAAITRLVFGPTSPNPACREQVKKIVRTEAAKAVATLGVKISDDRLSGVVNEQIREFVEGKMRPTEKVQ